MSTKISLKRYLFAGCALLLAVLLAGCTGAPPAPPQTPAVTTAVPTVPAAPPPMTMEMTTPLLTTTPSPAATVTVAPPAVTTVAQTPKPLPGFAVGIQNNGFNPQVVTVPVGTNVTWTNLDSYQHLVSNRGTGIYGPGQLFESKPLNKGDTYSYTFITPGSYEYTCTLHTYMLGVVVVQ